MEADLSTLKRIERLPFSRFHWRLLWMGGLGYTFDAMDGAMIAFILPVVSSLWGLTNQQTGILGSSLMIGYLFGAFFAGTLGDLIGRRAVMMYALAIYCVGTLVAAFAQSWQFLFAWRVIASFGTGAESAIIAPFLAEFIQRKYRGRFVGSSPASSPSASCSRPCSGTSWSRARPTAGASSRSSARCRS